MLLYKIKEVYFFDQNYVNYLYFYYTISLIIILFLLLLFL